MLRHFFLWKLLAVIRYTLGVHIKELFRCWFIRYFFANGVMLLSFFAICCNVAIVVLSVYFLQSSKKEQIEKRLILLLYPQCYSQWVNRAPLCIILKIKIWVVAYLKFIIFFPSFKKTFLVYFMQLFSADAAMFFCFF